MLLAEHHLAKERVDGASDHSRCQFGSADALESEHKEHPHSGLVLVGAWTLLCLYYQHVRKRIHILAYCYAPDSIT